MPERETDWIAYLPHSEPFLFLNEIISMECGVEGNAVWRVDGNEAFFRGHFAARSVVPGVLIGEALAQLSGIVGAHAGEPRPESRADTVPGFLAHVDVRFFKAVEPPASIKLHSTLTRTLGAIRQFEVDACCDGETVARGSLMLSLPNAK